jgi:predicted enzyme related to lactoylglutathione lyase
MQPAERLSDKSLGRDGKLGATFAGSAAKKMDGVEAKPPAATGISELVLEVADLEASRAFYRDLLGMEETRYGEGREGRYWYLVGESARLGLLTEQIGLAGGRGGAHRAAVAMIAE